VGKAALGENTVRRRCALCDKKHTVSCALL